MWEDVPLKRKFYYVISNYQDESVTPKKPPVRGAAWSCPPSLCHSGHSRVSNTCTRPQVMLWAWHAATGCKAASFTLSAKTIWGQTEIHKKIKNIGVYFVLENSFFFIGDDQTHESELLWEIIRSLIFSNFFAVIGVGPVPLWDAKSIPAHKLARALKATLKHHEPQDLDQPTWNVHLTLILIFVSSVPLNVARLASFSSLLFRQNRVASLGWRWRCACRREVGQLLWPLRAPSGQCGGFSFRSAGPARRSKLLYNRSYSQ